jgi:hypothetical protein
MKKNVISTLFLFGVAVAPLTFAASTKNTVAGKVRSFNEKTVLLEVDGHLMEFDIRRVIDKKDLHVGQMTEVEVDSRMEKIK